MLKASDVWVLKSVFPSSVKIKVAPQLQQLIGAQLFSSSLTKV